MRQTEIEVEQAGQAPVGAGQRFGVFRRGDQRFALPLECLLEVIPGQELTRVPRAKREVAGLLNLRGEVLTVLLADAWLGLPPVPYQGAKPILVLRQENMLFGIQVDSVEGILSIPEDQIQPQLPGSPGLPRIRTLGGWHPPETGQAPLSLLASDAFVEVLGAANDSANPERLPPPTP